MMDGTSHAELMGNGYDYLFYNGPDPLRNMEAQRAIFRQYQSYPLNSIDGAGTPVQSYNGNGGQYFSVLQPPQMPAGTSPVVSDLLAGGTPHGIIGSQGLISFTDTQGQVF